MALALLLALGGGPVHGQEEVVSIIEERAAAHGVSALALVALSWCESRHNPGAIGAAGERGGAQLHPRGLLPHFRAQGYDDPHSAWQTWDYVARVLAGAFPGVTMRAWSCWGRR